MKNKKQIIIGAILLISILLISTKSMATSATVNTDTLKLRKGASTESDILGLLNLGEKLEIIEESGDWYKVKINSKTGYVHKDYVKVVEEQEKENQENNEQLNTTAQENVTEDINQVSNQGNSNNENNIQENEQTVKSEYTPIQTNTLKDTKCYILPLVNSNALTSIKKGTSITILNEVNGWLYIETEKLTGWIITNSVDLAALEQNNNADIENQVEENTQNNDENTQNQEEQTAATQEEIKVTVVAEKNMYVNTSSIYMRKGPGTNFEIVDSLILNASVTVTGEVEDWYQVKVNGNKGFIAKRLLSDKKTGDTTSRSAEERTDEANTSEQQITATTSKGEEIVNYAKQYLGCKYVYGGSGPSTFDCSGFTMYVYKHFGVSLSHSATAQSRNGSYVAKENLQPGDLVFFKDYQTMDGIGHCGIYIGNGNFIHASSGTGYCVKISTLLSGSYNTRYSTARRII